MKFQILILEPSGGVYGQEAIVCETQTKAKISKIDIQNRRGVCGHEEIVCETQTKAKFYE